MNPKVLVTGHPNSGTSFLCELVVAMGFSPGDPRCLKPADDHNRYGYWEHVPLQKYVRGLSGYDDRMHITGKYPSELLDFTQEEKEQTASLFEDAGVEVFKETGLPVMYRLFPFDSIYLVILRHRQAMYQSGNYAERDISFDKFCRNAEIYHGLCSRMLVETKKCMFVHYEGFGKNFDGYVSNIADFLDVTPDVPKLREIWRPRKSHAN